MNKAATLPSLAREVATEKFAPQVVEPETKLTTIKVPVVSTILVGYFSPRIDMTLDSNQAEALRAAMHGLQSKFTKLRNGKEIANGSDVLKWMLENMS